MGALGRDLAYGIVGENRGQPTGKDVLLCELGRPAEDAAVNPHPWRSLVVKNASPRDTPSESRSLNIFGRQFGRELRGNRLAEVLLRESNEFTHPGRAVRFGQWAGLVGNLMHRE